MFVLPSTPLSSYLSLTTFLINLLLQNFTANLNTRTIAIYYENETSPDFVNTIIEQLLNFNKPVIVIDLNSPKFPETIKIGHEIVHLFLWKDITIDNYYWLPGVSLIQRSESVFFIFEDAQSETFMRNLSQTLWFSLSNKLFSTVMVFQDVDTNETAMHVFRPFKGGTEVTSNIRARIDMGGYHVSVLLVVRPPNVMQLEATTDKRSETYGGRDGKMASFLSTYFNANFDYTSQATTVILVMQNDSNKSQYVPLDAVQDSDVFVGDDEVKPM